MPEWSRVVNTTTAEYIREREENVARNRRLYALLKSKGRISFNHFGTNMDWKVQFKRAPMQGYADSDVLTFSRKDRWKTATLDWRGYAATDSATEKEKLMNRDVAGIVKYYSETAPLLVDDCMDQIGDELYVDGAAAGNSKRWHGTETMFAGATASSSGLAPVGVNAASYAGLSTVLANFGGAWSPGTSSWPSGTGDAHFDFWTPLIVDYTSAITAANGGFASATATWAARCIEVLRYAIIKSKKNKSSKGRLDLILINDEMYRLWMGALESEQRLTITRNQKGGLYDLGFGDTVTFEGVDVSTEYGVPANVGYGWNTEQMEIRSLQDVLFKPKGPDEDISTMSYRFAILCYANLLFNPRYQLKFQALGGN